MLGYAIKEIGKRKKKYILNILVIALVVVLLITLNSLSAAYSEASRLPFEDIHSTIIIQKNGNVPENVSGALVSCSLAPIENNHIDEIRNIEGVKDVFYGLSLWVFDPGGFKRALGVNWYDSLGKKISSKLISGSVPKTDGEVLVEKTYAHQYGLKLGQSVSISEETFTISGIVETSGKDILAADVYLNLAPAQEIAYNSKNLQEVEKFEKSDINIIFVETEQTKVKEVSEKLNTLLNSASTGNKKTPTGQTIGTYTIYTPASFEDKISSIFTLSDRLTFILSAIVIIGAILIIIKSMSHTIFERRKEFGIMKAVGFKIKDIQKQVAAETFIQVFVGYIIGLFASIAAILALAGTTISISIPWELNPYPHFLASDPSSVSTVQNYSLPISFQPAYALLALAIVVFVGLLTSFVIINHIRKIKPMEVLKDE